MLSDLCLPVCDVSVLCPNGWMDKNGTMEAGLVPGHIVLDGDPASPQKGHSPKFSAMSVVAKRLDGFRCHLVQRKASVQATLC